jgi:hypothetical protein
MLDTNTVSYLIKGHPAVIHRVMAAAAPLDLLTASHAPGAADFPLFP